MDTKLGMTAQTAVIFDLDGTLLDTLVDIADSANAVLAQQGCPIHTLDDYRRFIGDGVSILFQRALPAERNTPEMVNQCLQGFDLEYGARWHAATQPYDGVTQLLAELQHRAIPLAILSNKPDGFTKQCVARYFAAVPFVEVLGQRPHVPRKPDPAGAIELSEKLHVPPAQIWYLGDTPTDMQTARSAGMRAIGAAWGFRTADELRSAGASTIIAEPCELLALLK